MKPLLLIAGILICVSASAQVPSNDQNWVLTWNDEFTPSANDPEAPDTNKWIYKYGITEIFRRVNITILILEMDQILKFIEALEMNLLLGC